MGRFKAVPLSVFCAETGWVLFSESTFRWEQC